MKWSYLKVTNISLVDIWITISYASKGLINYVILLIIFAPLFYKINKSNEDAGLSLLKASWLTFIPTLIIYYFGVYVQSVYSANVVFIHGEFMLVYITLLSLGTGLLYYDRTDN